MKVQQPIEGVIGAVPKHMRTAEEDALLEQAAVEDWIGALLAGETPPPAPIQGEWSTVQEVAARHRCATKTIRKAIHSGQLVAVNHAAKGSDPRQSRYRIHRDAETAWIKSKGEQKRETVKRKAQVRSTFKDLIQS